MVTGHIVKFDAVGVKVVEHSNAIFGLASVLDKVTVVGLRALVVSSEKKLNIK